MDGFPASSEPLQAVAGLQAILDRVREGDEGAPAELRAALDVAHGDSDGRSGP
jgi:hypothetical protein